MKTKANSKSSRNTLVLLTLAAMVFSFINLIPQPANACYCNCYYDKDCGWLSSCMYVDCLDWIKIEDDSIRKLQDGLCKFLERFSIDDIPHTSETLDLWLQAYEVAGASGGGPPDPGLIEQAQSLPLTEEQHNIIREIAISVQAAYLGLTEYPDTLEHRLGFFTPPSLSGDCIYSFPPEDNGALEPLDDNFLSVGYLVRQAMVQELNEPGVGVFESYMSQIPETFPDYEAYGRCEYPHPSGHEHDFPYYDDLACLNGELKAYVDDIVRGAYNLPNVVNFDGLSEHYWYNGDNQNLGDFYSGVSFGPHSTILEAAVYGYNDDGYPPHSGDAVLFTPTEPSIRADFPFQMSHVGLWYTSGQGNLYLEGYDRSGNLLASTTGVENYGSNDYLGITAPEISYAVVHNSNDFFTIDDFEFDQQECGAFIAMDPTSSPPIEVPQGSSFNFTGFLLNPCQNNIVTDVWIMVNVPDYGLYGPIQQFNNVTIPAGQWLIAPDVAHIERRSDK